VTRRRHGRRLGSSPRSNSTSWLRSPGYRGSGRQRRASASQPTTPYQFIGPGYLVTVHGPVNPAVTQDATLRETRAVLGRIEAGRLRPHSPFELSNAIVSALAQGQEGFVELATREVWPLEQRVTSGHLGDPEQFLEELFGTRHALLAVSNMATLGHQIYRRMSALARVIPQDRQPLVADLEDQFDRVAGVADGQIRYLEGVIEFYKARTDTKVTIAAERLALIAVLTLPITALSSVYGMNIIVNDQTDFPHLAVVVAAMMVISAVLLADDFCRTRITPVGNDCSGG
jgi:magnesium transporter